MSERIRITYRPNPAFEEAEEAVPRLFATIDLSPFGAQETIRDLPIYFRNLARPIGPMRQVYSTTVAGLPVEKGNLNSLEKSLEIYLGALVHFGRLPRYFFQVGESAWPIYHLPDQLVTRYPGSPVFSAETIGDLRLALADNFKIMGQIRSREEVSILLLCRHDLQLCPPLAVLRAAGTSDVPVYVDVRDGQRLLVAPVNAHALSVPLEKGSDLLRLQQAVANYLLDKGVVDAPSAVTLRKLSPATWQSVRQTLTRHSHSLSYHDHVDGRLVRCDVPVYRNGHVLVAKRSNRLQHSILYVGHDVETLQAGLGHELHRQGRLTSPNYVTVRAAEAAPPWSLTPSFTLA